VAENPGLAVVIPARNAAITIREALDSVAAQTRPPDQIVIVDDGSSDRTVPLVHEWSRRRDVPLQVVQQLPRGVAAARNTALRYVHAELVALLDADDLMLPHHLEQAERAFELVPELVLCFADVEVYAFERLIEPSFLDGKAIGSLQFDEHEGGLRVLRSSPYSSLLRGNYVPVSTTVLRKSAVERIGLYDESFINAADRDLNLRLSRSGRFGYYPEVAGHKRTGDDHLSHPCHVLTAQRHRLGVLEKMARSARALALSSDEIDRTRAARDVHLREMLYTASERGLSTYLETGSFLASKGFVRRVFSPRHVARACTRSIGAGRSPRGA
jgi:glycosyltransferase involved in cell wall biosynthesis